MELHHCTYIKRLNYSCASPKAEKSWRFWGIYVHVYKIETPQEAYRLAKINNGAPGIDGVTFDDIERSGVEEFLSQIQQELITPNLLSNEESREGNPERRRKVQNFGNTDDTRPSCPRSVKP
ncbi:hypothetical protein FACS189472_13720 [Alphaproteobacteria bacterium]|nr:hypothetical protein FACS189472_13720 [Alphaproteobacteria bacterium]